MSATVKRTQGAGEHYLFAIDSDLGFDSNAALAIRSHNSNHEKCQLGGRWWEQFDDLAMQLKTKPQ